MIKSWIEKPHLWLLKLGLVTVAFALISYYWIDQHFAQIFSQHLPFWHFNRDLTEAGRAEPYLFISLFAILAGALVSRFPQIHLFQLIPIHFERLKNWGVVFFVGLISGGVVLHLSKFLVGRLRPHRTPDFNPSQFNPQTLHWDWHSFPSGHAQTLMTASLYFILLAPKLRWLILAVAFYLGLTRALVQAHFVSDVLVGSYIGLATSTLSLHYLLKKKSTYSDLFLPIFGRPSK